MLRTFLVALQETLISVARWSRAFSLRLVGRKSLPTGRDTRIGSRHSSSHGTEASAEAASRTPALSENNTVSLGDGYSDVSSLPLADTTANAAPRSNPPAAQPVADRSQESWRPSGGVQSVPSLGHGIDEGSTEQTGHECSSGHSQQSGPGLTADSRGVRALTEESESKGELS